MPFQYNCIEGFDMQVFLLRRRNWKMLLTSYSRHILRLCFRRISPVVFLLICFYLILIFQAKSSKHLDDTTTTAATTMVTVTTSKMVGSCDYKPSIEQFILNYQPTTLLGTKSDVRRVEPTVERIRTLLEILRSKEAKYQSLLEKFDVFDLLQPMVSLKPYSNESNIEEIKTLYNRFIKLLPDKTHIDIAPEFINYLRLTSSYLSDKLRNQRTKQFEVKCLRKPVFVLACDERFFGGLQGAIRTLDTYWPDHQIVFYDLGIRPERKRLLIEKCKRCTIIDFPYSSIETYAAHIRILKYFAFKPFVVQDALRRYGTIIYGDTSARFNENSFDPVLIDNYIRGFAVRELPGLSLPCFTRTGVFSWFNQSYTQFETIYSTEAGFLVVTDTLLSRLIMKAWLTCVLEPACLLADGTKTMCGKESPPRHRYDQSAMGVILTYFFFQGNQSSWSGGKVNDPAPYDMFTSVQKNLGDIKRSQPETYLANKKI